MPILFHTISNSSFTILPNIQWYRIWDIHSIIKKRENTKNKNYVSTVVQPCGVPLKPLAAGNKISCVPLQCSWSRRHILWSTGCAIYKNSVKLCDTVLKCPISNYMKQNQKFHVHMTAYTNFMSTETQNRKFKESDIWGLWEEQFF